MGSSRIQLNDHALALLKSRLDYHRGSRSALAREIGMSRPSISMALDLKYPGNTAKIESLIYEKLLEMFACPHTKKDIAQKTCQNIRERSLIDLVGNPKDIDQWKACSRCHYNPSSKIKGVA